MPWQVKEHDRSQFWGMLGLVLQQFDGLVAGYQARHEAQPELIPPLTRRDFVFLNGNGKPLSALSTVVIFTHNIKFTCLDSNRAGSDSYYK